MAARSRLLAAPALLLLVALWGAPAEAHGIWGHIHVTGWAIENLPEGEVRDFFADPEVMNAALYGAAFTDSGYWPQGGSLEAPARAYGEHTHWEPFIEDFVAWMQVHDPPPWTSQESRLRVAFLMGCASHGLQDELFDSLFLDQAAQHDGAGQEATDPGIDGFLGLDGWLRFAPTPWIPMDVLLELYAPLDAGVDAEVIQRSADLMELVYLRRPEAAASLGRQYAAQLPWTRANYLNPDLPGSLRAEVLPTARYLQALWDRLHGADLTGSPVIYAWPDTPRRLGSGEAGSLDSRVTLIFGAGLRYGEAAPRWADEATGADVPFTRRNTRWDNPWTRLIRVWPDASLAPGSWQVVTLPAGATLIHGGATTGDFTHRVQVACDPGPACPPVEGAPVADLGEPSWPEEPDAGAPPEDVGGEEVEDVGEDVGEDVVEEDVGEEVGEVLPPRGSGANNGWACAASGRPDSGWGGGVWGLVALLGAALGVRGLRRPGS